MKKGIALIGVLVLMLVFGTVAYADSTNEVPQWYHDMMDWRRDQVQEAVEAGELTEEEAAYWNERMEEMEEYHVERGFGFGRGGFGPCHGENGRGFGSRRGFFGGARGMMSRF